MATPYDPSVNPYSINPRELPSNPAAAAKVPLWNTIDPKTGVAYAGGAAMNNWCYSPSFLGGVGNGTWGSMLVAPNQPPPGPPTTSPGQATSPISTASQTWPDAIVADRQATKVPTLTGVSPNPAAHGAAVPITITGYGLTGTTAVTVGGIACTAVTVVNDSTITCTTAATTVAGPATVAATTPAGTGTFTGLLTLT